METSTETPADPDSRPSAPAPPAWLVELLEVLELRQRTLLLAIGAVALVGVLVALFLPGFLPPRPAVGAAVGLAAVLLGVAITFGLDSLDLQVRGPRHVRSSGGLLAQQLTGTPSPETLGRLVSALGGRARTDGRVLVGLSPIDVELDAEGWQDALAGALADDGLRVLTVDLQRPAEPHPGVVEVAEGRSTLADAVTFDDERMVARLGPGSDPVAALGGLRTVIDRLPSDIDVLVVLLPPPSGGGVLGASSALDHVYLLAEVDRTTRVELIAALDAFDAVQATSQVLLITPRGAGEPAVDPAVLEDAPVVGEPLVKEAVVEDAPVVAEPVTEEPVPAEAAPMVEDEPVAAEPALPPAPEPVSASEPVADAEPVLDEPRQDDEQLRLLMAEAALELSDIPALGLPDEPEVEDALDEGDPTVETPPVVLDEEPWEAALTPEHEPEPEPEPAAERAPEPEPVAEAPVVEAPFPDQDDLPEDPERVAAALRFLGQEPWSPRVPAAPRG